MARMAPGPAVAETARQLWRSTLKRVGNTPLLWRSVGKLGAAYMRFVYATTGFTFEPGNPFDLYSNLAPLILTTWHGQVLMATSLMRPDYRVRGLASKSRDGDAAAAYYASFGVEIVRGSGGRDRRYTVEKGGIRAFLLLKKSLEEGISVATTADISNTVGRRCGEGIVTLARLTGRPVIPMGFATSRWLGLHSWDRATFHLPFSRGAVVAGAPVFVPADANEAVFEAKRLEIEHGINAAVDRAYALVGKRRDWQV